MKKRPLKYLSFSKVLLFLLSLTFCVGIWIYQNTYSMYAMGIALLVWLFSHIVRSYRQERWAFIANILLTELKNDISSYVDTANIPMALTDKRQTVRWSNPAFIGLVGKNSYSNKLSHLIKDFNKPSKDKSVIYNDKKYIKEVFEHQIGTKTYYLYRLVDPKTNLSTSTVYQKYLGVIAIIQIDNYSELSASNENLSSAEVTYSIEKILYDFAMPINGFLKKTDRDTYILVFERRYLAGLIQSKFEVLDKISNINVDGARPTISIAIGVGNDLKNSYLSAQKSLELAIGRGGNQAVIRRKDKFSFYGGPKGSIIRSSKIKSRMLSHALRNLMEQCDKVFIMGHSTPDFDSFGSAMGIAACSRFLNKPTYIVLEPPTASLDSYIDNIKTHEEYNGKIISPNESLSIVTPSSLVVIVDTQIEQLCASPELLRISETTVVIDHHLKGANNIGDAILYYHEPFASSTAELVTEIVQYFDDSIKLLSFEAEALLSGITVDTKSFSFKTGVRTFEAASYLRKFGADTTTIKRYFKNDFETVLAKSEVIRTVERIRDNIALGFCPRGIKAPQIVAAQSADALVSINGISTAFVFSMCENDVLISGRSIDGQNVQLILERIGGGGHSTIAGARLKSISYEQAREILIEAIEKDNK